MIAIVLSMKSPSCILLLTFLILLGLMVFVYTTLLTDAPIVNPSTTLTMKPMSRISVFENPFLPATKAVIRSRTPAKASRNHLNCVPISCAAVAAPHLLYYVIVGSGVVIDPVNVIIADEEYVVVTSSEFAV